MNEYPYMLIMRNSIGGMIWQAYTVKNDHEVKLLTNSATSNGFIVSREEVGYTEESTPGWRNTQEWKDYSAGILSPRAKGQAEAREILKSIRRDGPYWLSGYKDWLISCYSIRSVEDLHGFIPIACYSELKDNSYCLQWMICKKDNRFYMDCLKGSDYNKRGYDGYGLDPKPIESQTYPSHIYDWIFKDVLKDEKDLFPTKS